MTSLTAQMDALQKQQAILAEKIKEEEERKKKLNSGASICRLEALIEPITHHLDWTSTDPHSVDTMGSQRKYLSANYERQEQKRLMRNQTLAPHRQNHNAIPKYMYNHMLANEEIFVTLLGIIKKQDARIGELEGIIKKLNKPTKLGLGPHADGDWNYA